MEGVVNRVTVTQKGSFTTEKHVFVIEKYVENVKQDEKDVPDLLEAIMRPTCLVKEELQQNLFKMTQFRSKITKIMVSTFWIPEIRSFPAGGQCQASRHLVLSNIYSKKCGF